MDDSKTVTVTPATPTHIQHGALVLAVEVPTPTLPELFEVDRAGSAGFTVDLPCKVRLVSSFALHRDDRVAAAADNTPTMTARQLVEPVTGTVKD